MNGKNCNSKVEAIEKRSELKFVGFVEQRMKLHDSSTLVQQYKIADDCLNFLKTSFDLTLKNRSKAQAIAHKYEEGDQMCNPYS